MSEELTIRQKDVDEFNAILSKKNINKGSYSITDGGRLVFKNNLNQIVKPTTVRKNGVTKALNDGLIPSGRILKTSDDVEDFFFEAKNNIYGSKRFSSTPYEKSMLKWAGGKGKILCFLTSNFPINAKRLIEPFVGSGIVFLNTDYENLIINDINADLIGLYKVLMSNADELIKECKSLFKLGGEENYYKFRDEFNSIDSKTSPLRNSALFVYLNKYGFNGLCRYNSNGGFNSPWGKHENIEFNSSAMLAMHKRLKDSYCKIMNADFKAVMQEAVDGDVVYCDPPYLPISDTAYFTSYHTKGFSFKDQKDLVTEAIASTQRGATVVISNHDTVEARELYKDADRIVEIKVTRSISSKGSGRKKVGEIIAIYESKKGM